MRDVPEHADRIECRKLNVLRTGHGPCSYQWLCPPKCMMASVPFIPK